MSYETPHSDDFVGERFSHAGIRQPGQIDALSLVICVPDCVTTGLGPIDAGLVSTLRDRRYDYAPVSGLPTRVGWGLARRSVLEALQSAGIQLGAKDVDVSDAVIRVAGGVFGNDTLDSLLGFFSDSPAVLLVYHYGDASRQGVEPSRGAVLGLLTVSDLNHRDVRRSAYELLLEVEQSLVELLRLENADPWKWIDSMAREDDRARLIGYWELMRRRDVETSPEILLTLPQLIGIAGKSEWIRGRLGFRSRTALEASVHDLPEFRNRVMHPARPLVSDLGDVARFRHTVRGLDALLAAVKRGLEE